MVSLWMVTGILLYLAFIRLLHSDYHIEGGAMLLTASIAVCANLLYVPVWSRHHVGVGVRGPPAGWESRLFTQQTRSRELVLLLSCTSSQGSPAHPLRE